MTPPVPPSAATPLRPLPQQRTQVAPYGWLRRHIGGVAAAAPVLTGGAAWAAGVLGGVDPIKAFQQLGAPVACLVLLAAALAWTYLVFVPQRDAAAERTRQLLLEAHAAQVQEILTAHSDDRAIFQSTMAAHRQSFERLAEEAGMQRSILEELARRMGRLEDAIADAPTSPGTPAHRAAPQRSTGAHRTVPAAPAPDEVHPLFARERLPIGGRGDRG